MWSALSPITVWEGWDGWVGGQVWPTLIIWRDKFGLGKQCSLLYLQPQPCPALATAATARFRYNWCEFTHRAPMPLLWLGYFCMITEKLQCWKSKLFFLIKLTFQQDNKYVSSLLNCPQVQFQKVKPLKKSQFYLVQMVEADIIALVCLPADGLKPTWKNVSTTVRVIRYD